MLGTEAQSHADSGAEQLRPPSIDSFAIEPGAILLDRFCALGRAVHQGGRWHVLVSDLQREFGRAPNHRLVLDHFPHGDVNEHSVCNASAVERHVQPIVYGCARVTTGVIAFTEERTGQPLTETLNDAEIVDLARTLAGLLVRLHQSGVHGVEFDTNNIRVISGGFRLTSVGHLLGRGTEQSDIRHLMQLLRRKATDISIDLLATDPKSAMELMERVSTGTKEGTVHWSAVLPADAPFVGRKEAINKILAGLAQARIARPQFLVLQGERGAGKSRLLRQMAADLERGDTALVLRGSYFRGTGESRSALSQALDALPETANAIPPLELKALCARIRTNTTPLTGVLGRLSNPLKDWLGETQEVPEITLGEDFLRLATVVSSALQAIGTQRRPLVLLIDNLEEASAGSLAALKALMQSPQAHHTLVVAGCRGEIPAEVQSTADTLDVKRLSVAEVHELLRRSLPGAIDNALNIAESLHRRTDGVALAVWAHLQEWIDEGRITRTDSSHAWTFRDNATSPHNIIDLYRYRVDQLDHTAKSVALVAALHGSDVTAGWLLHAMRLEESTARDAIRSLVQRGIMREHADGQLLFAHDSVRELVGDLASSTEKTAAHRMIATFLEQSGYRVPSPELAYHREHQQDAGNDEALADLHVRAGQHMLTVFDLDRAEWHFDRAIRRTARTTVQVQALQGCADVSAMRGDADAAVQRYREAMNLAESHELRIGIATSAVYTLMCRAGNAPAASVASHALALVDQPIPTSTLGQAFAALAALLKMTMRIEPRISHSLRERLCELYTRLSTLYLATPTLLAVSVLRGAYLAGNLRTAAAATSLAYWGVMLSALGRFKRAEELFIDAEERARESKHLWSIGLILHMRGHCIDLPLGRYKAGQERMNSAVEHFDSTGDMSVAAITLMLKAFYGKDRETTSTLRTWLEKAERAARRHENNLTRFPVEALLLLVDARTGAPGMKERADAFSARLAEHEKHMIVADILTARTSLAAVYRCLGDSERAFTEGQQAASRVMSGPVVDFMMEIFVVTTAAALDAPYLTAERRKFVVRSLRRLATVTHNVPRLQVAHHFLSARLLFADKGSDQLVLEAFGKALRAAENEGAALVVAEIESAMARVELARSSLNAVERTRHARQIAAALEIDGGSLPYASKDPPSTLSMLSGERDPVEAPLLQIPLSSSQTFDQVARGVGNSEARFEGEATLHQPESRLVDAWTLALLNFRDEFGSSQYVLSTVRYSTTRGSSDYEWILELEIPTSTRTLGDKTGFLRNIRTAFRDFNLSTVLYEPTRQGHRLVIGVSYGAESPGDAATPKRSSAGTGSILVVHSDSRVCNTIATTLSNSGYGNATTCNAIPAAGSWSLAFIEHKLLSPENLGDTRFARVITVAPRDHSPKPGEQWLRIPYSVDDLLTLAELAFKSPSETAQKPE